MWIIYFSNVFGVFCIKICIFKGENFLTSFARDFARENHSLLYVINSWWTFFNYIAYKISSISLLQRNWQGNIFCTFYRLFLPSVQFCFRNCLIFWCSSGYTTSPNFIGQLLRSNNTKLYFHTIYLVKSASNIFFLSLSSPHQNLLLF